MYEDDYEDYYRLKTFTECYLYYLKDGKLMREYGDVFPNIAQNFFDYDEAMDFINTKLCNNNCVFNILDDEDKDEFYTILENEYSLDLDKINISKVIMLKDFTIQLKTPDNKVTEISKLKELDLNIVKEMFTKILLNEFSVDKNKEWQNLKTILELYKK